MPSVMPLPRLPRSLHKIKLCGRDGPANDGIGHYNVSGGLRLRSSLLLLNMKILNPLSMGVTLFAFPSFRFMSWM
jgi:hypothetical protein